MFLLRGTVLLLSNNDAHKITWVRFTESCCLEKLETNQSRVCFRLYVVVLPASVGTPVATKLSVPVSAWRQLDAGIFVRKRDSAGSHTGCVRRAITGDL